MEASNIGNRGETILIAAPDKPSKFSRRHILRLKSPTTRPKEQEVAIVSKFYLKSISKILLVVVLANFIISNDIVPKIFQNYIYIFEYFILFQRS